MCEADMGEGEWSEQNSFASLLDHEESLRILLPDKPSSLLSQHHRGVNERVCSFWIGSP